MIRVSEGALEKLRELSLVEGRPVTRVVDRLLEVVPGLKRGTAVLREAGERVVSMEGRDYVAGESVTVNVPVEVVNRALGAAERGLKNAAEGSAPVKPVLDRLDRLARVRRLVDAVVDGKTADQALGATSVAQPESGEPPVKELKTEVGGDHDQRRGRGGRGLGGF